MAHSAGKINPSAVLVLLLVLLQLVAIDTAAARIRAEAASVEAFFPCNGHLSGNFKGPCFGWINDKGCKRTCLAESSDNDSGECDFLQCWCTRTKCTSETAQTGAAASAPIPA